MTRAFGHPAPCARAVAGALLFTAAASILPARNALAQSCELPPGGQALASADASVRLSYRFEPPVLQTDRHFTLLIDACGIPDGATLNVDALMPEHRHGMNYKPVVVRLGPGAWRADGLLLHMPGRWEFRFELRNGDRVERFAHTVAVQ